MVARPRTTYYGVPVRRLPATIGNLVREATELLGVLRSTSDGAEVFTVEEQLRLAARLAADPDTAEKCQRLGHRLKAAYQRERLTSRSPRAQILVTHSRIYAYLTLVPPAPTRALCRVEDILTEIERKSISLGLQTDMIEAAWKKFSQRREMVLGLRIATGSLPRRGRHATIEYEVPILDLDAAFRPPLPQKLPWLSNLPTARARQSLARFSPATEGRPGMTVTGEKISTDPGAPLGIQFGKGTQLEDQLLVALTEGTPLLYRGHLTIDKAHALDHVHEGEIPEAITPGLLFVAGGVEGKAVLRAEHILVAGDVREADLFAAGTIVVGGKLEGDSRLRAIGDIRFSDAAGACIESLSDIVITGTASGCTIRAGREVRADARQAEIRGGHVEAQSEICVRRVAPHDAMGTRLQVGPNDLRPRFEELLKRLKSNFENKLDSLAKKIDRLQGDAAHLADLTPGQQDECLEALLQSRKLRRTLERSFDAFRRPPERLPSRSPVIRIVERAAAPLELCVGKASHRALKPLERSLVSATEDGQIEVQAIA